MLGGFRNSKELRGQGGVLMFHAANIGRRNVLAGGVSFGVNLPRYPFRSGEGVMRFHGEGVSFFHRAFISSQSSQFTFSLSVAFQV